MNEIGSQIGSDSGLIVITIIALALFGAFYNWLIQKLHERGYNDGYVWLEVVVGVAVTLLAASFTFGRDNAMWLFIYFTASGAPMAAGDILRHVRARQAEAETARQDV